jgi:hypothetical protein
MKTFKLVHEKPRKLFFEAYYNGKRIKNKKQYLFQPNTSITLVEKNEMIGKFWWIYFFIAFIGAFGSNPSDWKHVRRSRKTVVLRFGNIFSDILQLSIGKNAESYSLEGVQDFSIESEIEEDCSRLVEKRIKNHKKIVLVTMLSILVIILVALAITLLNK